MLSIGITSKHVRVFTILVMSTLIGATFVAPTMAVAQDEGAPKWGKWLRRFNKDKLLKPPFHNEPEEGVKGLASKIRARELDIPNRKRAVEYLKDLDCRSFPEAKAMLVEVMLTDKWEPVRYQAAAGLRDMLARHSCSPCAEPEEQTKLEQKLVGNTERNLDLAEKAAEKREKEAREKAGNCGCRLCRTGNGGQQGAPCHCTSCCDEDTLNALAKVAYEMDPEGCPFEPSYRVRSMAVKAIAACGIPCSFQPYYADEEVGPRLEEVGPAAIDGNFDNGDEVLPDDTKEVVPGAGGELPPLTKTTSDVSLNNLCIVSLKQGRMIEHNRQFSAVYRGRRYYFANAACEREFESHPDSYAVAFGGCDPVQYVETRHVVEGRYLVLHNDRFYMFSTKTNYQRFLAEPAVYDGSPRPMTQPKRDTILASEMQPKHVEPIAEPVATTISYSVEPIEPVKIDDAVLEAVDMTEPVTEPIDEPFAMLDLLPPAPETTKRTIDTVSNFEPADVEPVVAPIDVVEPAESTEVEEQVEASEPEILKVGGWRPARR